MYLQKMTGGSCLAERGNVQCQTSKSEGPIASSRTLPIKDNLNRRLTAKFLSHCRELEYLGGGNAKSALSSETILQHAHPRLDSYQRSE